MTRFLTTTAIVACLGLPALAEKHAMDGSAQMESMGLKASNLIDMRLFMADGDTDTNAMAEITDVPDTWQMVGDIDDLLIDQDGKVKAILVDAGGILGMGEKDRQIQMENVRFVQDADDEGEFFVVFTGDKATFEEQDRYDEARAQEEGTMRASQDERMAGEFESAPQRQQEQMDWANLTTEDLLGAAVYGSDNEWIGDLSELNLSDDGKISGVIVDVGGFLGLGEKPVQLGIDQIEIRRTGANELRAYVNATEEELESMEAWSPDT